MKNKKFIAAILTLALVLVCGLMPFAMADSTPGSTSDPVVTKSYVDKLVQNIEAKLAELSEQLKKGGSSSSTGAQQGSGDSSSFKVVQLEANQSVLGAEGTEIILRSGAATAVDNEAKDGLSDLTAGNAVYGGTSILKNHHLLVPREDGRGIHCTEMCYIMVKGGYTIK